MSVIYSEWGKKSKVLSTIPCEHRMSMSSVAFSTFCFLSCLPVSMWNSRCFYLLFFIHKIIYLSRYQVWITYALVRLLLPYFWFYLLGCILFTSRWRKHSSCAICSLLCCSSVSCYLCKRIWNRVPCPFVPLASVITLDYRLPVVTGNRLLIWSIATSLS